MKAGFRLITVWITKLRLIEDRCSQDWSQTGRLSHLCLNCSQHTELVQESALEFGLGFQEAKIWWKERAHHTEGSEQRQENEDSVVPGLGENERLIC